MLGSLNNIDLIRWEQCHCYRPGLEVLDDATRTLRSLGSQAFQIC